MNYAEKMERESRLMGRIADWMEEHGRVLSDRQRSNAYTGVRIREIEIKEDELCCDQPPQVFFRRITIS